MKTWKRFLTVCFAVSIVFSFIFVPAAMANPKNVVVAYFPGWPGTFEYGWAKGWFEKEMGAKVDFREFGSGADMTMAMASGDISIAYAMGTTPFTIAVTQGLPIKMIAVSENYSKSENLVARGDTTIVSPRDLIGKKVGVPFGTTAHYRLMGILDTFGIQENQLQIIDMRNPDILPAFVRKDIHAGCAWEPVVSKMMENNGTILVSSEDQIRWGYSTYGLVAVTNEFADNHPDLVVKFLQVMNDSTVAYHKDPGSTHELIGKVAGLSAQNTKEIMDTMVFYSKDVQLSRQWMGQSNKKGNTAAHLKKVADFLAERGELDKALDSYDQVIDPSFMEKVK